MAFLSFLDRSHTVAKPGFSRWMVPPAALCVHLCIGQAYALSVFNLPMTKLIGISQSTPEDWKLTELGWIFSIAMLFLGGSAAVFGRWVEEGGPRKAMFTAGCLWAGGFFLSAIGVKLHMLWLIYLGYGVLGGCALGIGYISPVSTLIKWFPDRPGMATGMAIMGFGGGAFIASPLSVWLMSKQRHPCRRDGNLRGDGRDLFLLHDGRRHHRPRAGAGLEARRLYATRGRDQDDQPQRRLCL